MAQAGLNYKKNWGFEISLDCPFKRENISLFSYQGRIRILSKWDRSRASSLSGFQYKHTVISPMCFFVGISTDLLLEFRSVSAVIYLQQLYWGICEDCSGWDQQNLFVDSLSGDRSNAVYFGFGIFLELVGIPTVCDIGLALYSKVGLSFSDGISRTDIYSSANRLHVFSPYFLNAYHFVLRILRWDSIKNENHRWIGFVL